MKKILYCLPLLFAITLVSCGDENITTTSSNNSDESSLVTTSDITSSNIDSTSTNIDSTSQVDRYVELFDDPSFSTGFHLKSVSTSDAHVVKHLDYDGAAIESSRDIWNMAQWWTPFDFQYAPYKYEDGYHIYQNESRTLKVNTEKQEIHMQLNSWLEYQERFGGSRVETSQTWSHFLIEQNFSTSMMLSQLNSLVLSFDFEIPTVQLFDEEHYNPSVHAAQFIMYFTIRNTEFNNFFWFGVPLFDNRGNEANPSYNIDQGFEGATNSLIYRMGQKDFLPNGVEVGKKYSVNVDLIPFLQEALITGSTQTSNPPLKGWDWNNCYINYMNCGWELPGSFNIESNMSNLSLMAELY